MAICNISRLGRVTQRRARFPPFTRNRGRGRLAIMNPVPEGPWRDTRDTGSHTVKKDANNRPFVSKDE